jgi:guanine nucleotide-binding protein G(i) subunit alpha
LHGLLYFTAVDEYDIPSEEVDELSKLQVSLNIWEEIIHGEAIAGHVAIILFLNKADLLEKRLKKNAKSLKKAFKDYSGGKDVDKALEYLKTQFMSRVRPGGALNANQIYVHSTCALDTNQMGLVFNSVRDFVVQQRMMKANLL